MYSASVNFSDVLMCQSEDKGPFIKDKVMLPLIPGSELCGEVIEVGKDVKNLHEGDRVIALNKDSYGAFAQESTAHVHVKNIKLLEISL